MEHLVLNAYKARNTALRAMLLLASATGVTQINRTAYDPIWLHRISETLAALALIAKLFDSTIVQEQSNKAAVVFKESELGDNELSFISPNGPQPKVTNPYSKIDFRLRRPPGMGHLFHFTMEGASL